MRALVIGGGVAGLASAIALRSAGLDVLVCERAQRLEEVGAGLTLAPDAMQALELLGVAAAIRRRGARGLRVRVPNARGRTLVEIDLARDGREAYGIHRAELQRVLVDALPADTVRLGRRCVGIEQRADAARARFDDETEEAADVVVGADGIHSVVRTQLFGEARLRYGEHAGWRSVVPFEHELVAGTWTETWGRGARVGIVPIGAGRVYVYVAEDVPEGSPPPAAPEAEFQRRFASWHDPIPAALAAAAPGAFARTFVYDLRPLRRWSVGRVTLAGDAAHPMRPDIGMGAAVALEDAVVLGNALRAGGDVPTALRRYESCRRKRAAFVTRLSRRAGSFAQCKTTLACRLRDAVAAATPARLTEAQYRRQIDWDPECARG